MGYTHYWRREQELDPAAFTGFAADFSKVYEASKDRIPLAGGLGEGLPSITADEVIFNGVEDCGHTVRDLGVAWPADEAGGVDTSGADVTAGNWFAGAKLSARTCDGRCSHETFWFPRVMEMEPYDKPDECGRYFQFCKTAFKPYDVLVTATLIIAKHRFGDAIQVSSDGDQKDWFDGQMLCQSVLGYGLSYDLKTLGGE